ncbi:MAG: hypothetical protein ACLQLH_03590 [Terracidiphilus sp.]
MSRRVCRCSICSTPGHETVWLPERTKSNPEGQPELVERCSSCKSRRWNDDDPKVISSKLAPKPLTDAQMKKRQANAANSKHRATLRKREKSTATQKPGASRKVALCRHRIIDSNCPVCGKGKR